MVGGVASMLGLISTPGQIWLSVAPVDLRRESMVCLHWCSRPWDSNPVLDRPLCFATQSVIVSRFCCGWQWRVAVSAPITSGAFYLAQPGECSFSITQAQWEWLIAGVDWQRLSALPLSIYKSD